MTSTIAVVVHFRDSRRLGSGVGVSVGVVDFANGDLYAWKLGFCGWLHTYLSGQESVVVVLD